jgi:endogenous inhibitor of DNA gyrase (YacG/DUF329 family)
MNKKTKSLPLIPDAVITADLVSRFKAGQSIMQISQQTGYSETVIKRRLEIIGALNYQPKQTVKCDNCGKVLRMSLQKLTESVYHFCNTDCKRIYIKKYRNSNAYKQLNPEEKQAILTEYKNGTTLLEIARKYNRSYSGIYGAVRKKGVIFKKTEYKYEGICAICGEPKKTNHRKYCSRECYYAHKKAMMSTQNKHIQRMARAVLLALGVHIRRTQPIYHLNDNQWVNHPNNLIAFKDHVELAAWLLGNDITPLFDGRKNYALNTKKVLDFYNGSANIEINKRYKSNKTKRAEMPKRKTKEEKTK